MEQIKTAIALAKKGRGKSLLKANVTPDHGASAQTRRPVEPGKAPNPAPNRRPTNIKLDRNYLQQQRIIAYDGLDRRSGYYDMLRTQMLQILDEAGLKTIAITSPRPGVGKTVTSLNLAFSIARQPEQSVLLVDLDLRRPKVAQYLGMKVSSDIRTLLDAPSLPSDLVVRPDLADGRLSILAGNQNVANSSELISSSQMKSLTKQFKADAAYSVVIYDLPPMLSSDDFLAFLPYVDCAMLIAGVGNSSVHDIAECERLIGVDKFMGCVLNKATEAESPYGYYK